MLKVTKLLNILTIVMFAITVMLIGLFVFGGELPNPNIHRLYTLTN